MEPRRRFRFLKELSEGAFGKVYLAEMVTGDNFKSVVAIKLLHGKWAGHEEIVQRSRDEARVLGLLHHRNIIRVEDLTSISGQVAIIMEYLNGVDLKTLVARTRDSGERIPRKVAFDICSQVASALEAAYYHRPLQGSEPLLLIHRDIKPSNVMLTVAGEVKVLDFGTAQAQFDDREAHTQALAFGSAAYMAPERLLGDPDAPSGDIFSLGIALYELLAMDSLGKIHIRPEKFEAKLERRMEALALSDLAPERADQVRAALRLMLAYDPNERPTATQVVELLEALADEIHDGSMRRFCREIVAPIRETMEPEQDPNDPLTGSTLFEDSGGLLNRLEEGAWLQQKAAPDAPAGPAAVVAPDLRMPETPSMDTGHVPDPGASFLPGDEADDGATAPPIADGPPATEDAGSGPAESAALDAETVRISAAEARRLIEPEASAEVAEPATKVASSAGGSGSAASRRAETDPPAASSKDPATAAHHAVVHPPGRKPTQEATTKEDRTAAPSPSLPARPPAGKKGSPGRTVGVALAVALVLVAVVGGAVATGVVELGDAPEPVPAPATTPDEAGLLQAGTVEVAELNENRGIARLIVQPPGQAVVDIRASMGDFKQSWNGAGRLEFIGLEAGTYKTKVKPRAGGSAMRGTLEVEPGSDCTYIFDLKQGEEWQKDCQ